MTSIYHWVPSIFVPWQLLIKLLITAKVLVITLIRLTLKAGVGNQGGNRETKESGVKMQGIRVGMKGIQGNGDKNAGNQGLNQGNERKW